MTNRIYAQNENTLTIDTSNLVITGDASFNSALNLNAINSEQINFLNKNFIKITDLSFNNTIKSIALSGNGERLAIGFPEDNNGQGLVKLYDLSDNKWHFLLDISSVNDIYDLSEYHGLVNEIQNNDRDNFGYSVSLNHKGDRLAVGAPNMLLYTKKIKNLSQNSSNDVSNVAYRFGAVYVYHINDTSYTLIEGYHQGQIEDQIDGLPSDNPSAYIQNSNIPTIIGNFTSGPLNFSDGQKLGDIVKLSNDGHRVAFTIKHGFNRNFLFDAQTANYYSTYIKNAKTTGQLQVWDYSGNIFIPAYIDNDFTTLPNAEKIRNFGVPLVHDTSGTTGINSLVLSGDGNTIVFGSTHDFIDPTTNDFNDISSGILTGLRYNDPSFIRINEISFNEPGYNLGSQVDIDDSGNIIIYSTTDISQGAVFILDICDQLQLTDHKITSEFKDYEITRSSYNNFGSSISLSSDGANMFIADNCYNLIRRYNLYKNDFIIDYTIPTNVNDNSYSNPNLITTNHSLEKISVLNFTSDPSYTIMTYKLQDIKDTSNIIINSNILPNENNKYNLGSREPPKMWDNIFSKKLHIDSIASHDSGIEINSDASITGNLDVTGTHTITTNLTLLQGSELEIQSDLNAGINILKTGSTDNPGGTTPSVSFAESLNQNKYRVVIDNYGVIAIRYDGVTDTRTPSNNDIWMSGSTIYSNRSPIRSDDRLKFNETDISNALNVIRKLKPQDYDKSTELNQEVDTKKESGFIAQDVVLIPELQHAVIQPVDSNGKFYLNYNQIFVYGIASLQELDSIVQNQQTEINILKTKNELLESKLNELLIEAGKTPI